MSREYIIALDGGGTKTDLILLDLQGNIIDAIKWGTTSHEFLEGGMTALRAELKKMFDYLYDKNGISPENIKFGVFGMAGVDTVYQQEKIHGMIKENGIKNSIVCNDGYLGIKAGTSKGVGINVINGTGCSLTGINQKGEMIQLGGQAVVIDDIAGGYVIGKNVIKLVFEDIVMGGRKTVLSKMLMDKLGITDRELFMDELVRQTGEKVFKIKHLGKLIFEGAKQGDAPAKEYLKKTGEEIARYISVMAKKLNISGEALEVVLIGSVFLRSVDKTLNISMENKVKELLKNEDILFKPLKTKPVCGAAVWALENVTQVSKEAKEWVTEKVQEAVLKNDAL